MRFRLYSLLAITTLIALVSAGFVLTFSNLDAIYYPVALLCAFAIPTAPFVIAAFGATISYRKLSEPKGEAILIGLIVGGFLGAALSLMCMLLLGHIESKYW